MFIVALEDLHTLQPILDQKPEAIVLGLAGFSARCHADVQIEDLASWVDFFHHQGIALFINAQGLLEQDQIGSAQKAFEALMQAHVDGIYIADEGWIAIADGFAQQNGLDSLRDFLIMQPETLLCSGQDANFYLAQGLQAASLSHELALPEIIEALKWNPLHHASKQPSTLPFSSWSMPKGIELLVAGHYSWMESRRGLVENYLRFLGQEEKFEAKKIYTIQEAMREARLPIWQDEKGTHVLSDVPLNVGRDLVELHQAGLNRYRIDAFLMSNEWAAQKLAAFREVLKSTSNQEDEIPHLEPSTLSHQQTWIKKEG